MGKVTVQFTATNYDDLSDVARHKSKRKPRHVSAEALIDTGATRLYLQVSVIKSLGLRAVNEISSRTMSDRSEKRIIYSPVDLEIQGRRGTFEVIALPDTLPNIIGQIPLEHLDWVVDLRNRKLIPNPEHKHGEMADDFGEDLTPTQLTKSTSPAGGRRATRSEAGRVQEQPEQGVGEGVKQRRLLNK